MSVFAIGCMSGTSLDGLDIALVEIEGCGVNTKLQLIEFENNPLPDGLRKDLELCFHHDKSSSAFICSTNFKMGEFIGKSIDSFLKTKNFDRKNLSFIASHGQTIYHIPKDEGNFMASTLQIGEPAMIAYLTGVRTISNFRTMDMAAGGQGAPLVPYTEFLLYRSNRNRALQNIGGIGNVTVLPADCSEADVFAFDTGPGNMMIDESTRLLFGKKYDKGGEIAASGNIVKLLLDELMSIPYISQKPPKTTGRELFGAQLTGEIISRYKTSAPADIVATMTAFTARSIAENYKKFVLNTCNIEEAILGGGGSYNKTLVKMIAEQLPDIKVMVQEDLGFSSDAKEAIAFAVMGNETINNLPSNLPSATGASRKVILGSITPAPARD